MPPQPICQIMLRVPYDLAKNVEEIARQEKMPVNRCYLRLVAEALAAREIPERALSDELHA